MVPTHFQQSRDPANGLKMKSSGGICKYECLRVYNIYSLWISLFTNIKPDTSESSCYFPIVSYGALCFQDIKLILSGFLRISKIPRRKTHLPTRASFSSFNGWSDNLCHAELLWGKEKNGKYVQHLPIRIQYTVGALTIVHINV